MKALFLLLIAPLLIAEAHSQELIWRKAFNSYGIGAISFSRDGSLLLISEGSRISVAESDKGSLIDSVSLGIPLGEEIRGDTIRSLRGIRAARFSPDERKVYLGYTVLIQSIPSCIEYFHEQIPGMRIWQFDPGKGFSPDTLCGIGANEVPAGGEGNNLLGYKNLSDTLSVLYLHNLASGKRQTDTLHGSIRYLATGDTLFAVLTGQSLQIRKFSDLGIVKVLPPEIISYWSFDFIGDRLIVCRSADNASRYDVYDIEAGGYLWSFYQRDPVKVVSMSRDGRFRAYITGDYLEIADNAGRLNYTPVQALMYRIGPGINTIAFSPDGRRIVTGSQKGEVSCYDISHLVTEVEESVASEAGMIVRNGRILIPGEENSLIRLELFDLLGQKLGTEEVFLHEGAAGSGIIPRDRGLFFLKASAGQKVYTTRILN